MKPEVEARLNHMIEAAREAMEFAEGKSRGNLDEDRLLELALIKEIEIIGEAVSKLPAEVKEDAPEIPWEQIVAMRHRLVHDYDEVRRDLIWMTVERDLPDLVDRLQTFLGVD